MATAEVADQNEVDGRAPAPDPPADNLAIWRQVCVTDDDVVSDVKTSKGRFMHSAVKAIYQIRRATELFGPYGSTWGLRNPVFTEVLEGGELAEVVLQAEFYYPGGCYPAVSESRYSPGRDCRKSLITDALTKALSMLGFSADVFRGDFGPGATRIRPPEDEPEPENEGQDEEPIGRWLLNRMLDRCDDLKIDPDTYGPGALRSICQQLNVDPNSGAELEELERVLTKAIDAYTGPDEQAGKDFVDPNIGNDGQPVSTPDPDDGPSDAPPTLGDDTKRMAALHAWATNDLGADKDPHKLLHDALPEGIESLNDLPVNRVGPLKRRARLIWNGKAE